MVNVFFFPPYSCKALFEFLEALLHHFLKKLANALTEANLVPVTGSGRSIKGDFFLKGASAEV